MDIIHKVADYFVHPRSPSHEEHHNIFDPDAINGNHDDPASAPAEMGQGEASSSASNEEGGRPVRNRKKVEPYVASFVLKAKPLKEVQGRKRNTEAGEDDNALVSSQGSDMSLVSSQGSNMDPSSVLGVPMSLASFNLSVTLKPDNDPNAEGTTFICAAGPKTRRRGKEAIDRGQDVQSQSLGFLPPAERSDMATDVPGPSLDLLGDYGNYDADDSDTKRATRRGGKNARQRSKSPNVRIEDVTDHVEGGKGASPPKGRGRQKSETPQPAKRHEQEQETPEKGRGGKTPATPLSSIKKFAETPKSAGPQKYGRGRKKMEEPATPPPTPQPQDVDETPKVKGRKPSITLTPSPPTPQSSLETIFDESMLTPEAEPGTRIGRKKTPPPQSSLEKEAPKATRGRKTSQASQEKNLEETPKPTRGRKKSASPQVEEQPQAKQRKTGLDEDQESTMTDGSERYFPAREDMPSTTVPLDEVAKLERQKQAAKPRGRPQPPSPGKQTPKRKVAEEPGITDVSTSGRGGKRSSFRKKPQRKSEKAGTVFPVSRIHRMLREGQSNRMRVGVGAAVYAAAAVEYLVAEVLEISGMVAKGEKKRRINPHHLNRCIKGDTELDQLFGRAIIPEGGHEPYIHPALLPKKAPGKKEHSLLSEHEPPTKKAALAK